MHNSNKKRILTTMRNQNQETTPKTKFNSTITTNNRENFTHHTSQRRFNAIEIAIAIAAKSNSRIRLQFVNNMHNSNKKRNLKAMPNQHLKSKSNSPITTNNRDEKNHNHHQSNNVIVIINAPIYNNRIRNKTNNTRLQQFIWFVNVQVICSAKRAMATCSKL